MNVLTSRRVRVLRLIVLIAVSTMLSAVTAGIGISRAGPATVRRGSGLSGNALLAANRDRLAICVHAAAGGVVDMAQARARVQAALKEVAKHPKWSSFGYGVAPPVVHAGCPSPPYLLEPGVTVSSNGGVSGYSPV